MAINIRHTYNPDVSITFYDEDGITLLTEDGFTRNCEDMDDIAEEVSRVLVKHSFSRAEVCSTETGELLLVVERT